jgi:hypothetical protein
MAPWLFGGHEPGGEPPDGELSGVCTVPGADPVSSSLAIQVWSEVRVREDDVDCGGGQVGDLGVFGHG